MRLLKIILLFINLLFLVECSNSKQEVDAIVKKENQVLQRVIDAEIIYSDSAKVRVKINAPILEYYGGEKPYTEFKKGIIAVFFDENQREDTRMSAKYAIKRGLQNVVEARNNVIVINKNGDQLNTEQIIWDQPQDKITSNAFVKIRTKDQVIYGEGLESNQSFTNYHILRPKGFINLNVDNKDTI